MHKTNSRIHIAQNTLHELNLTKKIALTNCSKQNWNNSCQNKLHEANCAKETAQSILYIANCTNYNSTIRSLCTIRPQPSIKKQHDGTVPSPKKHQECNIECSIETQYWTPYWTLYWTQYWTPKLNPKSNQILNPMLSPKIKPNKT